MIYLAISNNKKLIFYAPCYTVLHDTFEIFLKKFQLRFTNYLRLFDHEEYFSQIC